MNNPFLRFSAWIRDWIDGRIARKPVIRQWDTEITVSSTKTTKMQSRLSADPITQAVRGDYSPRRKRPPRTPRKDGAS